MAATKKSQQQRAARVAAQSIPVGSATTFLGEIVAWDFPTGVTVSQADLAAALTAAGLDDKLAKVLHPRFAFTRAVRELSEKRIVRNLNENPAEIKFQLTREFLDHGQYDFTFEAFAAMDKATGKIRCTDANLEARLTAEFQLCLERRKIADITRLLQSLFGQNADLFAVKFPAGVYFVPQSYVGFIDQVEKFCAALGGNLRRFPIPDGTPQGNASTQTIVHDGIGDVLADYETTLETINRDSDEKVLARAARKLQEIDDKVSQYRDLLGTAAIRLEDDVARVRMLLEKRKDVIPAEQLPPAPPIDPVMQNVI